MVELSLFYLVSWQISHREVHRASQVVRSAMIEEGLAGDQPEFLAMQLSLAATS